MVEEDIRLVVFGEGVVFYYFDKDWNAIYPKTGDVIPANTILHIEYYNNYNLDIWFYGNEEEVVECDQTLEALGICVLNKE